MIQCIYTITNTIDNKVYVGRTVDFIRRKNHHLMYFRKNTHNNEYLQRVYNLYGEENIKIEILDTHEREYLPSLEHYWCNLLDAHNYKNGYNMKPTHPLDKGGK